MTQSSSTPINRERITAKLPVELIERMRNAVYWTPGLTLTELIAQAVSERLDLIEAQRGEPFPPRQGNLKTGRPIRS